MVTDTFSDMLTRIRNASSVKSSSVNVIRTKMAVDMAKILKEEGFIDSFEFRTVRSNDDFLCIFLKYLGLKKKPYLTSLKRISKPGLRVYVNKKNIPKVFNGIGIAVLSTSRGLLTDGQARNMNVGGEVLCHIW